MDFFSLPPFFANFASSLPLAPRTFNFAFAAVLGSEARGGLKGSRYSAAPNSLSVLPAAFPRARARFFRSPLAFPSPRPFFSFFFLPSPPPNRLFMLWKVETVDPAVLFSLSLFLSFFPDLSLLPRAARRFLCAFCVCARARVPQLTSHIMKRTRGYLAVRWGAEKMTAACDRRGKRW